MHDPLTCQPNTNNLVAHLGKESLAKTKRLKRRVYTIYKINRAQGPLWSFNGISKTKENCYIV